VKEGPPPPPTSASAPTHLDIHHKGPTAATAASACPREHRAAPIQPRPVSSAWPMELLETVGEDQQTALNRPHAQEEQWSSVRAVKIHDPKTI